MKHIEYLVEKKQEGKNMKKNAIKVGVIIGLVLLLFGTSISPIIQATSAQKEKSIYLRQKTTETKVGGDYWAVFVTTFESTFMYEALNTKPHWNTSHIKLLSMGNATKQNILDALDWVIQHSDSDDIVVFADNSHGTRKITGECGIVPWDFDQEGMISTTELNEKFDQINAKGLCLIFDCCFSGNFVDRQMSMGIQNILNFNSAIYRGIEGENRVILMSTKRGGTGAFIGITDPKTNQTTTIAFIKFVAEAFTNKIDYNNDGTCSAEEAFRYAKKTFFPYSLFLFFNPLVQLLSLINSGGFLILPFPTLYDSYDGELPIVTI